MMTHSFCFIHHTHGLFGIFGSTLVSICSCMHTVNTLSELGYGVLISVYFEEPVLRSAIYVRLCFQFVGSVLSLLGQFSLFSLC